MKFENVKVGGLYYAPKGIFFHEINKPSFHPPRLIAKLVPFIVCNKEINDNVYHIKILYKDIIGEILGMTTQNNVGIKKYFY